MKFLSLLLPLLLVAVTLASMPSPTRAAQAMPVLTVDAAQPVGKVSPMHYGLMTEELNHAYDGGLYAELVRNRAFLDDEKAPAHWSPVGSGNAAAADRVK